MIKRKLNTNYMSSLGQVPRGSSPLCHPCSLERGSRSKQNPFSGFSCLCTRMTQMFGMTLVVLLFFAQPSQATLTLEDCPPAVGTLFNGKNSGTYCVSNIRMTWWSAFTWCAGIGGKLATWQEACPTTQIGGNPCGNMNTGGLNVDSWTAEPTTSDTNAYIVKPSNGSTGNRFRTTLCSALCI